MNSGQLMDGVCRAIVLFLSSLLVYLVEMVFRLATLWILMTRMRSYALELCLILSNLLPMKSPDITLPIYRIEAGALIVLRPGGIMRLKRLVLIHAICLYLYWTIVILVKAQVQIHLLSS